MRVLTAGLVILLAGCAQPAVDASSIDPQLLIRLEARLAAELKTSGAVSTPHLPPDDKCRVTDLVITPTATNYILSWSYRNPGDYDQNGEVNSADLVTIAQHFGARDTDADWAHASLADGDDNGEVTISDVSPIAANYRNAVAGYGVFGELGDCNCDGIVNASDLTPLGVLLNGTNEVPVRATALRAPLTFGDLSDVGTLVETCSPGLAGPFLAIYIASTMKSDATSGQRRFEIRLGPIELKEFLIGVAPMSLGPGEFDDPQVGPFTSGPLPGHLIAD
jgi:hypothetical protein